MTKMYGLLQLIIKHPTRDACLYLGEMGDSVGLPAPAFSIIAQQSLGGFSFNMAHAWSMPGKNF